MILGGKKVFFYVITDQKVQKSDEYRKKSYFVK